MATIYFNNGKEIWTSLTIEELKKITVDSKDYILIESERIICDELNKPSIKCKQKYFININSVSYIEESISNYLNNEGSI